MPELDWPSNNVKIYINDDLTKKRADLAFKARKEKKAGRIAETWVSNGKILVKKKKTDKPTVIKNIQELGHFILSSSS